MNIASRKELLIKAFGPSKPFIQCPFCGKNEFGVMDINPNSYWRKCKACWKNGEPVKLPPLNKKLIYLDQFVISNITKSLDKSNKKNKLKDKDPYWFNLYNKLDFLNKAQLIVCPYSQYHFKESLSTPVFEKHKRIYKHLANNVKLNQHTIIRDNQICDAFELWLNKTITTTNLGIAQIVDERFNKWENRFRISAEFKITEEEILELQKEKLILYNGLITIAEGWKSEKPNIKNNFKDEIGSLGPALIARYINDIQSNDFFSDSIFMVSRLNSICAKNNIKPEDSINKIAEFFNSLEIQSIPFMKISSYLFSMIRYKIQSGMKVKKIDAGTYNDVNAISSYIPYVDAVFIDNTQASYIKELNDRRLIQYKAKVFSTDTRDLFMEYLNDIEKSVPSSHYDLIREVYGEEWLKPFNTILD